MRDAEARPLLPEEIAAGRQIEQFVRDRLDAGNVLTIIVMSPDGSMASLHMACNPPLAPEPRAVLDTAIIALRAAREKLG